LEISVVFDRRFRSSRVLALDLVLQDPDFFDVKLDRIAVFEKPAKFNPTAIADGA